LAAFIKILLLFLFCTVKFVLGVPAVYAAYKFNFVELTLFSSVAGITGVFFFYFLGDWLSHQRTIFRQRFYPPKPKRPRKRFTRGNRIYVKVIKNYGLLGLALITPTIISIPVGSMIAGRLFHNKKLVLTYLSASVVLWAATLSALLNLF